MKYYSLLRKSIAVNMFVTEMMALTGNRRRTVSWTSIGIVVLSLLSPLPSVYGRVLPRNGDYGVVYQKVPKDMTDALNSYLDLVVLKFNSEATQRGLEPYVSTVSFPEPGFLRGVFIHGLGQWRRVGDVQVLRQWNTGRMFDVHVQTTVVMEIPKFDEHHHHHHPHREDEPADGERAVVEGDHDHDHHHAHVLNINNEAPIGEPQATVTRTLDAVFRVHEMFRRSQGDKSQGNTFRTESLFVQPEDDAVVKLSDTVTQRAGSYDKLVSQFAEFEMGRILRNPYMRKSLIRAMDNVLQTSGLRMGGLGEGARGSGTDAVFPVITDGVNLTPGPQTEIQKYPAEEMAASDADVPQPFEVAPDPDATGPASDSQLEVLSDSTDRVLEEGEENLVEEASKEESQLDAMDSTSAGEVTDPAVVDDSQKAVEEVSEPVILMDDVPPVPVEDTPTAKRRRILFV